MANLFLFIARFFLNSNSFGILLLFCYSFSGFSTTAEAYDPLDPNGNITIKWDVLSWTPDGYVAVVTIFNFQQYRYIQEPGWKLGWRWAEKEVIWNIIGAQTTEQGDCSSFEIYIPHSCRKDPTVVDLLPGSVPYSEQIANCCKGGVLNPWNQNPATAFSSFQLTVGQAGNTNKTVRLPNNFTFDAPGGGYTCGRIKIVRPTRFISPDKRRVTQALMTWNVTCTYSQFLAKEKPSCCVSLSSFYDETRVPCPQCPCGCKNTSQPVSNSKNTSQPVSNIGAQAPSPSPAPHVAPPPMVSSTWKNSYTISYLLKLTPLVLLI